MRLHMRGAFLLLASTLWCDLLGGCARTKLDVTLYADGFDPRRVHFEQEDLGTMTRPALEALRRRTDIDGAALLPTSSAGITDASTHAVLLTFFIDNDERTASAPPVVRLDAPVGRPARPPVAFRGAEISAGRTGRVRLLVELWPEERSLVATVSSSVFLVVGAGAPADHVEHGQEEKP